MSDEVKKVTVTNVGADEYHGYDQGLEPAGLGLSPRVVLAPGESAEVSERKAAQLTEDHPEWFEVGGGKPKRSGKNADAE